MKNLLPSILLTALLVLPLPSATANRQEEDYGQCFEAITALMKQYGEKDNVSYMKVGRAAMTMGKTFGKAAISDPWVRMVIKAFKKVSGVFILDYGECQASTKEMIEEGIANYLSPNYLVYSKEDQQGGTVDEAYGSSSSDGSTVTDLVIFLHGQSVICIRGSLAATDVPRTVGRLKRQL